MKIVVCYASPDYKSRLTDELVSAGKEYVQKYFPKGLLDIYWLNTKKQSLEKYLLKNEGISAVFVPENMTDTIEVVKRHKIKIEKFGEKDTEKRKTYYGTTTKKFLWRRFEPYLLQSFTTLYKINKETLVVKKLIPETTQLSELTDVSCLFFQNTEDLKVYLKEQSAKEIANIEVQLRTLEKKRETLLMNKEESLKLIEEL